MQKMILILITILMSLSVYAQKKTAVIFGASCNEEDPITQELMTEDMDDNAKSLKKLNWKPVVLHDTSRKDLIEALKKQVKGLKQNDQLMLTIQTHGTEASSKVAHSICMNGGKDMAIDDQEFIQILVLAKEKGVKIGILTDACYGGGAVEKLSKYSCVLSSQSKFTPAVGRPSRKMFEKFMPGEIPESYLDKLPDGYQLGVTTEMSRIIDKMPNANLGDVYLSTLINYNSEIVVVDIDKDFNEGNFPQFSGHLFTGNQRLEDVASIVGNYQRIKSHAFDIKQKDKKLILSPIGAQAEEGEVCSYTSLTNELSGLLSFLKETSTEAQFKQMMIKYSGKYAPKFDSLKDFLSKYEDQLNQQRELSKEYDLNFKEWNGHSSKLTDAINAGESLEVVQELRGRELELRERQADLQNRLKPLEQSMYINYNILKALDFYSTPEALNPCRSFSL